MPSGWGQTGGKSADAGRDQALDGRVGFKGGEPNLVGEDGIGDSVALQRNELQSYSQVLRLETGARSHGGWLLVRKNAAVCGNRGTVMQ